MTDSPARAFLAEFHAAHPGLTPKAFGDLPVVFEGRVFTSSYDVLATAVPPGDAATALLDLGCGDGHLLSLLAARRQANLSLSGIDMSAAELALARARLGPGVVLREAMAQALPFQAGRFDVVLCHLAVMLMDEAERVMGEVRRVLKAGGRFMAVVGAPPPPSPAFTAYVEALSRQARQDRFVEVRFGDRRWRDPAGIDQLLSPHFRDISVGHAHITQRLGPGELWRRFLDMYDLHLLSDAGRMAAEREFQSAVAGAVGADGKLDHAETLGVIQATAV